MRKLVLALSALAMTAGVAPSKASAQSYYQTYSYSNGYTQQQYSDMQRCAVRDAWGRTVRDTRCERRLARRRSWHQPYGNAYGYYDQQPSYGYNDTEEVDSRNVWYGNDGRQYCRRSDGTVGTIIGAGAGALAGHSIDRYGERTTGTVIGAVVGGLLGRSVERSDAYQCSRR